MIKYHAGSGSTPPALWITDTETASLKGGVCDIAIVAVDVNLNVLWEVESLIDPERPIDPGASGIHGIVDEDVWDKPTLSEFMALTDHPFQHPGLHLCGHNIQFDARMLASTLPEAYRSLCTLKLARNLWTESVSDHKLQTLRYSFKLEAGPAHRAMGDVITCLSLLRYVMKTQDVDFDGLLALARKPLTLDWKLPFSKYKGTKLRDLPAGMVKWLLDKPDLDPDLREALALRKS